MDWNSTVSVVYNVRRLSFFNPLPNAVNFLTILKFSSKKFILCFSTSSTHQHGRLPSRLREYTENFLSCCTFPLVPSSKKFIRFASAKKTAFLSNLRCSIHHPAKKQLGNGRDSRSFEQRLLPTCYLAVHQPDKLIDDKQCPVMETSILLFGQVSG